MVGKAFKITIIALAVIVLTAMYWRMSQSAHTSEHATLMRIGNTVVAVLVADTITSQMQGLSGRENLGANEGVLFTYPDKKIRNFWMKDMRFPLDVLWIADGAVVGMQENISHEALNGDVARFKSNQEVDMVLEVNAGWIAEHAVKKGDSSVLDTKVN